MPRRMQRQHREGWRLPAHAVCVTRPGRWGHPLKIGKDGDRAQLLALSADDARARLAAEPEWLAPVRGKDLTCWCVEGEACHAGLLLRLANASPPAPPGDTGAASMGRIILAALCWLVRTSPAPAVTVRCTTYEDRTLNRLHCSCVSSRAIGVGADSCRTGTCSAGQGIRHTTDNVTFKGVT